MMVRVVENEGSLDLSTIERSPHCKIRQLARGGHLPVEGGRRTAVEISTVNFTSERQTYL